MGGWFGGFADYSHLNDILLGNGENIQSLGAEIVVECGDKDVINWILINYFKSGGIIENIIVIWSFICFSIIYLDIIRCIFVFPGFLFVCERFLIGIICNYFVVSWIFL